VINPESGLNDVTGRKMMNDTIGFVGAGNMGGALIRGILEAGSVRSSGVLVSDPRAEILEDLKKRYPGIRTGTGNALAAAASMVVLAVKPQIYEPVIREIRDTVTPGAVVVTIAAGITIRKVISWFDRPVKVVRTMPNTPALISRGITALCPADGVEPEILSRVEAVFKAVGETVTLPERLMDAFTALAGSSPAWVFMFLEALADGAVREGIPRESAYRIAAQAVMGSAALAVETGEHPAVLKDRVCSPGGTTIEAVATLERAGFRSAVIQAVADSTSRGRELGAE
jgi:pyrroline-5-carboxylate reductase